MPFAISIGITKERFDDSTPEDLKYDFKAFNLKRRREDEDAWRNGFYMMSAINKALGGKKAKYIKEPLMESMQDNDTPEEEMSEAQKKKARDILLSKLQIMQANFEMNHKDDGGDADE